MGGLIINQPRTHVCSWLSGHRDGVWWYPSALAPVTRYPDGTVRLCDECGTFWVAGTLEGMVPNVWRKEGRLSRRWREWRRR